jgi:Sulfotransferase domain
MNSTRRDMYRQVISDLQIKMRHWLVKPKKPQLPKPYPIYPDDVFFVSYPRSGSSWLRPLVTVALNAESATEGRSSFNAAIPDMYGAGSRLVEYCRPRMIKSHEPYQPLYPKVIYLYRDGRDVAVSYYNFYRTVRQYGGTFDDFLGLFLKGKVNFGRWDIHVDSWMFGEFSAPLLAVAYEELHRNTSKTVARVMEFLGHSSSDKAIQTAVAQCTFERRQEHVKNRSPHYLKGYRGGVGGKAGGWCENLSNQQATMLWDAMGATLKRLGYQQSP